MMIDRLSITRLLRSGRTDSYGALDISSATLFFTFLALGTISALKGLNLNLPSAQSYFYFVDYRFGFVVRGLVGQLFAPLLALFPPSAHGDLLIGWHYLVLAALLVALSRFAARTVTATGRADVLAMAILLFCSPLIPSMARFTAVLDPLLCLLTLGLVAAIRAQRLALAWLIFVVGTLAHQLMIFIALPLMILGSLIHAKQPAVAVAGSAAIGIVACLVLLLAPAPDERLIGQFTEHGISAQSARAFLRWQLGQSIGEMLGQLAIMWRKEFVNAMIGLAYGASAALAILGCLFASGAVRPARLNLASLRPDRLKTVLAALLVLGAGLSPLLSLAIAYDLSRLAALSAFTSFLVADMLLRRDPALAPSARAGPATSACAALAALFLCLPGMTLFFDHAVLNTEAPLVRDPVLEAGPAREAIDALVKFVGRNNPPRRLAVTCGVAQGSGQGLHPGSFPGREGATSFQPPPGPGPVRPDEGAVAPATTSAAAPSPADPPASCPGPSPSASGSLVPPPIISSAGWTCPGRELGRSAGQVCRMEQDGLQLQLDSMDLLATPTLGAQAWSSVQSARRLQKRT